MNKLAAWAGKVSGSRYPTSGRGKRSGGTVFQSKGALAAYSQKHPKADMSKHSVAASAPKAAPAAAPAARPAAAPTAAPAAAPTAPLPAAGSSEHSRREEVAKSAAQGGEREASRGADAMRAGKVGLAANHYMKAATNHLALHPTHGSLESQITKAESALSSAAAALDRVTDRASAKRLDASMREAKGEVANMKKFAAMKPEQREAEVIKRNASSRMR